MEYIYHGVPEQMIGNTLVPLNQMGTELADIRAQNLKKYDGREEVMRKVIPLLGCLWNDAVQFLPLHPQKVFDLQRELGLIPNVPAYTFYEIPLESLDPNRTVVFFKTAPGEENTEVSWLKDSDFDSMQVVPPATRAYYETLVGTGELPFNYQFVPHILHNGSIDISDARVITLA